eukprot:UN21168
MLWLHSRSPFKYMSTKVRGMASEELARLVYQCLLGNTSHSPESAFDFLSGNDTKVEVKSSIIQSYNKKINSDLCFVTSSRIILTS